MARAHGVDIAQVRFRAECGAAGPPGCGHVRGAGHTNAARPSQLVLSTLTGRYVEQDAYVFVVCLCACMHAHIYMCIYATSPQLSTIFVP